MNDEFLEMTRNFLSPREIGDVLKEAQVAREQAEIQHLKGQVNTLEARVRWMPWVAGFGFLVGTLMYVLFKRFLFQH